jgi:hypothetical protein
MKTMILAMAFAALPATAIAQPAAPATPPHTVSGELTLFQMTNYNGDTMVVQHLGGAVHTDWPIRSINVFPGDRWQICARPRYHDPCIILDRSIPDATMIGIDNQIGSARLAPTPAAPAQPH